MMNYTNAVETGLRAIYAANPKLTRSIAQDKEILEKIALFAGRNDLVPNNELYRLALYENASHPSEAPSSPIYNDAASALQHKGEAAAQRALEQANRAVWDTITTHWDVSDIESNFQILCSWVGAGEPITIEKFQLFLESGQGGDLEWRGTRNRLLAEIGNEMGGDYTEASVAAFFQRRAALAHRQAKGEFVALAPLSRIESEIYRMSFWTKAQLRAKLAELRYSRTVRGKTADELRGDLAAYRASEHSDNPYHPHQKMPAEITAAAIKAAPTSRIMQWNRVYGHEQVRARLNNLA